MFNLQTLALLSSIFLSSATAGVVVPRAATDICGKKGYDQGKGNYYYGSSSKINTYAACSAKCAADATCKSFGYGGACLLFNIPLSGNFDADTGSKDIYYDKACLSAASTSAASTSSLLSTSTSSVKTTSSTAAKTTTLSVTSTTTKTSSTTTSSKTSVAPSTTTTATSAASTVTVPSGCPAPASVELTGLTWFNSTHNLDCPNPNYPSGSQVCFDSTKLCVDQYDGVAGGPVVCSCTSFCSTGLPSAAYQPYGYGPPDTISISLNEPSVPSCSARMPTGFRDFEIGSGHVNCGSAADTIQFNGDSNKDSGGVGTLGYTGYTYGSTAACKGTPHYSGSFPLSCTRDTGGNATCTLTEGKATLNLVAFY